MRFTLSALVLLAPAVLSAQERVTLDGREVAIYNLVGRLRVEGGTGSSVVVEVTRRGRDAARLRLDNSTVRGRSALRVQYPGDRIVYPEMSWGGRSTFDVSDDGTFNDDNNGWRRGGRRRIEVTRSGDGLEAYADLHVVVPNGKSLYLRQGFGETTIDNVNGDLHVSVSASRTRVSRVKGSLDLDTGSGGVEVTDLDGSLKLDAGSGGAVLANVRGESLDMDVGSGSVRGRDITVHTLKGDIGSGGIKLNAVRASSVHIETGSGGSDIEMLSAPDEVSVEAGSGGVTLRLPANTNAAIDIETGSGGIDTDFEVKLSKMERRSLRGTIGTGRGRIHVEAGSGTVKLLKS